MNKIGEEQRWHSDWPPLRLLKVKATASPTIDMAAGKICRCGFASSEYRVRWRGQAADRLIGLAGRVRPGPTCRDLRSAPEIPFANTVSSLGTRFADWLATAVDYYTAAAIYEQLSRLSDAELQRRGFSRATLALDICQACDRGNF
jgi:hypothetical protein